MSARKMPPRAENDGPVGVQRGDDRIVIEARTDGEWQTLVVSEHNAWRVLGMLSVLLDLPLSPAAAKAIKM